MTNFTVRVELHDADSDDYTDLHKKMEAKGFKRTILNGDGTKYQLPTAEYSYSGDMKRSEVLNKAFEVAKTVKKNPSVLVTESAGRTWRGLDEV